MKNLKLTQEGIKKAMESRNSVLEAMGFDSDNSIIEVSEKEIIIEDTFSKYGNIEEKEIASNVYEVYYEKQSLYIQDLNTQKRGFFVGE
jgi:hypothetical protein